MTLTDAAEIDVPDFSPVIITVEHVLEFEHRGHQSGKIKVSWDYLDPGSGNRERRNSGTTTFEWHKSGHAEPARLRIADFIVPSRIRGCGVGTVTWSLVAKTANRLGVRLQIRGGLSERDLTSNDHVNRLLSHSLQEVDNAPRRNALWARLLNGSGTLTARADGTGHFEGFLADPIPCASDYSHAIRWR